MNCIEQDIQRGIEFGYNWCCIKNYINLQLLGYLPGIFMDAVLGHNKNFVDYVLCPICYEKLSKIFPNKTAPPRNEFWGEGPAVDRVFNKYYQLRDSISV